MYSDTVGDKNIQYRKNMRNLQKVADWPASLNQWQMVILWFLNQVLYLQSLQNDTETFQIYHKEIEHQQDAT
jgi:hypothetical protein